MSIKVHPEFALAFAVLAAAISGCGEPEPGAVRLAWIDTSGRELRDPAQVDFGTPFGGNSVRRSLFLANSSTDELVAVNSVTLVPRESPPDRATEPFRIVQLPAGVLQPGERRTLEVEFTAPIVERWGIEIDSYVHDVIVQAVTWTGNPLEARLPLLAGAAVGCGSIDGLNPFVFSPVLVGEAEVLYHPVWNPMQIPMRARIGPLEGEPEDLEAFSFDEGSLHGAVEIPPEGEGEIRIRFSPKKQRTYRAIIRYSPDPNCPMAPVEVTGEGI